ncbi:MAG: hypothetical protein RJA70_4937 [Pseudomonadota bacterium]|jgi:hypothetical protein
MSNLAEEFRELSARSADAGIDENEIAVPPAPSDPTNRPAPAEPIAAGGNAPSGGGSGGVDENEQSAGGAGGEPMSCIPRCVPKQCGDNGCGKSCGDCDAGESCDGGGRCVCTPQCDGKQCGDDGCGAPCGMCDGGGMCDAAGKCTPGVLYEVEAGVPSGASTSGSTVSGYAGVGYASFGGAEGTWQLNVIAEGGERNMVIRYASDAYRALAIAVNGKPQTQHVFQGAGVMNRTWTTDIIPRVVLRAGNNSITFTSVGQSGPDLDHVAFAAPVYSVQQEAEAFTTGACAGTLVADGGVAVSDCPASGINVYNLNVPTAGPATVTFRATSTGIGANLRLLDASDTNIGEVWLLQTGVDQYQSYSTRTGPLNAGEATLKVVVAGAGSRQNWFTLDR